MSYNLFKHFFNKSVKSKKMLPPKNTMTIRSYPVNVNAESAAVNTIKIFIGQMPSFCGTECSKKPAE